MTHPRFTHLALGARRGSRAVVAQAAALAFAALALPVHAGLEEGRAKAQVCAACHGADGNSPSPEIPSLAGQPAQFIVSALYMFREGRRVNAQMTPFVEKLSNADLNDLSLFYASLRLAPPKLKMPDDQVARARAVTEKNNCVACHTPTFVGQQHIPRVAGQHKAYLLTQLKGFKAGTRADIDGTMTSAAQGLAADELELVADYLSSFSPP
ncbi:MAG: cytochrome c4 [Polaromonas sp.]|nr:cytochrome c4 [Polaromonas sp.]